MWISHIKSSQHWHLITKLWNCTFVGFYIMKFASTKIVEYYIPTTQKSGCTSHAYFNKLSIGIGTNRCKSSTFLNPGKYLIFKYLNCPPDSIFSPIRSNFSKISILIHPDLTYKIIIPPKDDLYPMYFHDNDIYGLTYVREKYTSCSYTHRKPTTYTDL